MRSTLLIIIALWSTFVVGVSLACADDSAPVFVPSGCHIAADSMAAVHLVLCDADNACTQRVVNVVCGGAK